MSTQPEIQVSYDVGNDFFRLWLDKRMNYTCGLFEGTDDLDQAQINKLAFLYEYAGVRPDASVLDIGCGWGANLEYLAVDRGVRDVHGITLSPAQHAEIVRRRLPNVTCHCISYEDYEPDQRFDALMSICMIEHVCTPEQARAGGAVAAYRRYFRRAHAWAKPGARFGLQTILRDRIPRDRELLQDIGWVTYAIFPGGITPRMEDVVAAASPWWEILEVRTRRLHYKRTCEKWLEGLRSHEREIRERWGDDVFRDYEKYLSTCVTAFDRHCQSLAQWCLKRIDG